VQSDPTALIIAALSAGLSFVLGILVKIIWSMAQSAKKELAETQGEVRNAALLYKQIEGDIKEARAQSAHMRSDIEALKKDSLSKELFQNETNRQNDTLGELRATTSELARQLLKRPTWSQAGWPAARQGPPTPREEPESDPPEPLPPPMRGRLPSRSR
jgi:hypothetical protein